MKVSMAMPHIRRPDLSTNIIKDMGDQIEFVEITLEPSPVLAEMGIMKKTTIRIGPHDGGRKLEISCDVGTLIVEPMSEQFILLDISYG